MRCASSSACTSRTRRARTRCCSLNSIRSFRSTNTMRSATNLRKRRTSFSAETASRRTWMRSRAWRRRWGFMIWPSSRRTFETGLVYPARARRASSDKNGQTAAPERGGACSLPASRLFGALECHHMKHAITSCLLLFSAAMAADAQPLAVRPKLAVIGLVHSHVWNHLGRMAAMPEANLVGIAEPNQELAAEAKKLAPNAEYFTDYKQMIEAKQPNVVWAFVENNRHLEIVEYCAPRQIHVIFEKPLAATYADALRIRDLAKKYGIQVMTNYQMAWWPANYTAKAQADSGAIGPVWRLHGIVGHGGPSSSGVRNKFFFDWLTDPVKNGAG